MPLPLGVNKFLASLTRMRSEPLLLLELFDRRSVDPDDFLNVETTSTPGGTNLRATIISPR